MGKLILFNMVSVDGFFEGRNKDISWHNVDDEFNKFAIEQLNSAGTLVFGRLTYELMAVYWPSEQAKADDPVVRDKMNSISKIVFSKTLGSVTWENTKLFKGNVEQVIKGVKQNSEKNIFVFGSADLASTLSQLKLIDEYRIIINPVILGQGRPLFKDAFILKLKLKSVRKFNSGNVLLFYEPK